MCKVNKILTTDETENKFKELNYSNDPIFSVQLCRRGDRDHVVTVLLKLSNIKGAASRFWSFGCSLENLPESKYISLYFIISLPAGQKPRTGFTAFLEIWREKSFRQTCLFRPMQLHSSCCVSEVQRRQCRTQFVRCRHADG